jgi:ABC-type molybdate transport system ATPase subunit
MGWGWGWGLRGGVCVCGEQGKKNYGFQLDSGKQQYNLAALKLDDMKDWMKDIKEAKKKAVGVKVVSEDKASPDPASPRGSSPRNQQVP